MKCRKCKRNINRGLKFCTYCGAEVKKKSHKWIFVLFLIAALVCAVGGGVYKLGWLGFFNKSDSDNFFMLNYQFTDKKIDSPEDAIKAMTEIGGELGFDNALSELSEKISNTTTTGDTYYRLQQNYKGIPVYGRNVVLSANSDGQVLLTGANVVDVDKGISVEPSITDGKIKTSITDYYSKKGETNIEVYDFSNKDLIIYTLDGKQQLAYKIYVVTNKNAYETFVDAVNANILMDTPRIAMDRERTSANLRGQLQSYESVDISSENGINYLYDIDRNIRAYELETDVEKIASLFILEYYDNVYNGNQHEIEWSDVENLSNDNAVDAYVNVQNAYDYFSEALNNISTDGNNKAKIYVYTNYGYHHAENDEGEDYIKKTFDNAFSSSGIDDNESYYSQIIICNKRKYDTTFSAYLDIVAHEYTHAVNYWHNQLIYKGESGALDEALADIFGELVQCYIESNIDWFHGLSRDMKNPNETNQPSTYQQKKYWVDTSDTSENNDYGGVHTNSGVINHAAYLMWAGIDGNTKKNLNEQELAELWYRSLLMMPSDCTFAECRSIVEATAEHMTLSNHQRRCVSEAFDAVGINSADAIRYIVTQDFDLTVKDINLNNYIDYYITIDSRSIENSLTDADASLHIETQSGPHTITLVDRKDSSKTYRFNIETSAEGGARNYININTNFGQLIKANEEEKNINNQIVIDPSYPTNYDKNTMKYQRMSAKDAQYTYMKDTNGVLKRKNNDGSRGDADLYTEPFFTICGLDSSYIYLLKGSEEDGVYDIVRVAKDGKKTDVLLKSINWCLHMDETYFYYVPSDNNKSIRRIDRENITVSQFAEFDEQVELMIETDTGYMVVTREDNFFAAFFGASNNYYLVDNNGNITNTYGSNISVEEYPREKEDDWEYESAVKYVSNGYLRSTAAEVYIKHGGEFKEAKGISGWNDKKAGIITTIDNDSEDENALPYQIVLYDAKTGTSRKMTEVNSDQAFFTMCQDDNGDWCYIDQVDNELVLYVLSGDFQKKEQLTTIDTKTYNCDLENSGAEIMDNRIYFYSMPDSTTANSIYRYDVILED